MNLRNNPDLLDQLAASHALGTLRGGARRRFETMARESAEIRARALVWQECFGSMTELLPADRPSANVWKRIEIQLNSVRQQAVAATSSISAALVEQLRRARSLWRSAAMAGGLAAAAAVLVAVRLDGQVEQQGMALAQARTQEATLTAQLQQTSSELQQTSVRLQQSSNLEYVAVLQDDAAAASVLVTFDPVKRQLTMKRVGGYQEASDKSLQLWALPPSGGPQSLGVMGPDRMMQVSAAAGQVADVPALAISLEPKGGVPAGSGPTGPILFKGPLLKTTL